MTVDEEIERRDARDELRDDVEEPAIEVEVPVHERGIVVESGLVPRNDLLAVGALELLVPGNTVPSDGGQHHDGDACERSGTRDGPTGHTSTIMHRRRSGWYGLSGERMEICLRRDHWWRIEFADFSRVSSTRRATRRWPSAL